jgi:hypothetical protein
VEGLVKKFLAFYGTRRFLTIFTRASHCILPWGYKDNLIIHCWPITYVCMNVNYRIDTVWEPMWISQALKVTCVVKKRHSKCPLIATIQLSANKTRKCLSTTIGTICAHRHQLNSLVTGETRANVARFCPPLKCYSSKSSYNIKGYQHCISVLVQLQVQDRFSVFPYFYGESFRMWYSLEWLISSSFFGGIGRFSGLHCLQKSYTDPITAHLIQSAHSHTTFVGFI